MTQTTTQTHPLASIPFKHELLLADVDYRLSFLSFALASAHSENGIPDGALYGLSVILHDIRKELGQLQDEEECSSSDGL